MELGNGFTAPSSAGGVSGFLVPQRFGDRTEHGNVLRFALPF